MAQNADGSVTVKTPGKVASQPSGSGTGKVTPVAAKSSVKGFPGPTRVVPQKGRGAVPKTRNGK